MFWWFLVQDEDFIPLLDIQTGPGNDGAAGADANSTREQKQQQRELGYQPPWLLRLAHFSSPMLRLHNEIVAFCQMLAPTAEESASRSASLESLKGVVRGIWPSADVLVFGSYATGLYTPASDTDVVVVGTGGVDAQTGRQGEAVYNSCSAGG
jgi:non-canonical poly(A) RNA polymerase PAPD5/7